MCSLFPPRGRAAAAPSHGRGRGRLSPRQSGGVSAGSVTRGGWSRLGRSTGGGVRLCDRSESVKRIEGSDWINECEGKVCVCESGWCVWSVGKENKKRCIIDEEPPWLKIWRQEISASGGLRSISSESEWKKAKETEEEGRWTAGRKKEESWGGGSVWKKVDYQINYLSKFRFELFLSTFRCWGWENEESERRRGTDPFCGLWAEAYLLKNSFNLSLDHAAVLSCCIAFSIPRQSSSASSSLFASATNRPTLSINKRYGTGVFTNKPWFSRRTIRLWGHRTRLTFHHGLPPQSRGSMNIPTPFVFCLSLNFCEVDLAWNTLNLDNIRLNLAFVKLF